MSTKLDLDDILLAIIVAEEKKMEGRTRLQKLTYFVSKIIGYDAGFRPHYYGPYSPLVAAVVESQQSRGLLEESAFPFEFHDFPGHDGERKRYDYRLTEKGQQAYEWRYSENEDEFIQVQELVKKIGETGADYRDLSFAAKIFSVIKEKGRAMTEPEIRRAAKQLGWSLDEKEMKKGLELLNSLELVRSKRKEH